MHKDDKKWIKEQLMRLDSPQLRQLAMAKYNEVHQEAYNNEPLPHKKDGAARSEANNRLRVFVEKVTQNAK